MKAAQYAGNKVFEIADSTPVAPGAGEVRINVSHCGICGTDLHIYMGHMDQRVEIPQVIGHEMSGVIAEVGTDVTDWAIGDRVVVRPLDPCNECPACAAGHSHICQNLKFMGIDTPGGFQGSWTVPQHTLHRIPSGLGMDVAALIEPLAVACHDVRLGEVKEGETAVVIGGGPIGVLVAMVARMAGAKVLVAEINPFRIEFAQKLGFETINTKDAELVEHVMKATGDAGADIVFEVTASAYGADVMTQLPRTRGRIVVVGIYSQAPTVDLFRFFWRELKLVGARVYEPEDFDKAIELAASGTMPLADLITTQLPLAQLCDGLKLMEEGKPEMKIMIDVQGE